MLQVELALFGDDAPSLQLCQNVVALLDPDLEVRHAEVQGSVLARLPAVLRLVSQLDEGGLAVARLCADAVAESLVARLLRQLLENTTSHLVLDPDGDGVLSRRVAEGVL